MNDEQKKNDSNPKAGSDKESDLHVERLETEIAGLRAKLEKAGGEELTLRKKITTTTAALEAAQDQVRNLTSQHDQALDQIGVLSAQLEEETSARQLAEIERDDLAEHLRAERGAHARTERARASAQASADARGAAAAGLGLATAVSLIAHAARD